MKLIYLTVDGREIVENTKAISRRLIEEPDGYHPLTNDAVWHNVKRRHDTRMVVVDGVLPLLGADMTNDDLVTLFHESVVEEVSFKSLSVSKMWWRGAVRFGEWIVKFAPMMIVAVVIAWALYSSFVGGV
jgi:hypothetical protein